jgi:tetratricopeptide (TPR) repeat protein
MAEPQNYWTEQAGYEEAILCFDSALALTTKIVSGWMGRGTALHHLGRYEEALVPVRRRTSSEFPSESALDYQAPRPSRRPESWCPA